MALSAIIDCDPGHDDVMAILLGARTLDLRGITTVHGNASLEQTTRNARQTVEFAGLTVDPDRRRDATAPWCASRTTRPRCMARAASTARRCRRRRWRSIPGTPSILSWSTRIVCRICT